MHQHPARRRGTSILAIAIDCVYLNDRDEQLQETAGAPIRVSKCDPGRWIGAAIVPTKSANVCGSADLKNDVSGSRFCRGFRQVGRQASCPRPGGVNSGNIQVSRCDPQDRGECLVRLAKQRVGRERYEGFERCCANGYWLVSCGPSDRVRRRTSSLDLACAVLG